MVGADGGRACPSRTAKQPVSHCPVRCENMHTNDLPTVFAQLDPVAPPGSAVREGHALPSSFEGEAHRNGIKGRSLIKAGLLSRSRQLFQHRSRSPYRRTPSCAPPPPLPP